MSNDLINLMRDRFDSLDRKLDALHETFKEHVNKDETYWKKLDQQEGQLRLVRWVSGSGIITGIGTAALWVYKKLAS